MPVTLLNPDGLSSPPAGAYSHVAIAAGSRLVYVAGQTSVDQDGARVAPGDLAGQAAQAFRNVAVALRAAEASFADVVRLTMYVVDWTPDKMPALMAGIGSVAEELRISAAPASLIGVSMLFEPGVLIEVEATAVVD